MANFVAVLVARRAALGTAVRTAGLCGQPQLIAYTSTAAHACIARAMDYAGLGSQNLRLIPVDAEQRVSLPAMRDAVSADRSAGHAPFLMIGNAGTVDIGAIDDLAALADLAAAQDLWFHVDGAFGALGVLASRDRPSPGGHRARGLARAGFSQMGTGALRRGVSSWSVTAICTARPLPLRPLICNAPAVDWRAGEYWPNDFGPDLSRAFRALKTWFTLRVYGTRQLGEVIANSCRIARYLRSRILAEPRLELLAPVPLNIVCFRYRGADADTLNAAIAADVQESWHGAAVHDPHRWEIRNPGRDFQSPHPGA